MSLHVVRAEPGQAPLMATRDLTLVAVGRELVRGLELAGSSPASAGA